MKLLIIALFIGCAFRSAAAAAPLERWVYAQVNLLVPEEAQRLETLMRRARPLGFRYFLLADSKFTRISQMDARYHDHVKRIKQVASELGIEIVPSVFPVGYSNDLLFHDPNLAEGLPVRAALLVVSNGVAGIVADPPVSLPAPAERRRWGFVDENLQPDDGGRAQDHLHRSGNGKLVAQGILWLDSIGVAEYIGFHSVCFPFMELFELGFTTLGPPHPRRNPRSRRADTSRFHRQTWCLDGTQS